MKTMKIKKPQAPKMGLKDLAIVMPITKKKGGKCK